ncbi:ABC-F family ATP-binding cassette domain-containing protein [Candidatus Woesebacteria bacterium]|nr:ABC-F family ATP-binding cassette domain-containing protein [Candidatus Woesebacteria bacterium]
MIKATNISYSYGLNPLYNEASFSIGEHMIVGLVGTNGAGKSTLFNLLTAQDTPDAGLLEIDGTIEYVPQEVKHDITFEKSSTVRNFLDTDGKKTDSEIRKMLAGLELDAIPLTSNPQIFSGGQKTRLAICRALLKEPDILLLDEPTNFLDTKGKQWVMHFLAHYPKTVIVVSHDIKLLDRHISKVLAINTFTKKIEEYAGNYSQYLKLKKQRDTLVKKQIESEHKHIKHMEKGLLNMQRFTSKKGVRQRTTLKRRIERLKEHLPPLPQEARAIKVHIPEPSHVGEAPIIAKNISKTFGKNQILDNVSLTILRGERVALIGPNGIGKSTLIKILMNTLPADSGTIIHDEKIKIGYYSQEFETVDFDRTIIDCTSDAANLPENSVRPLLARFLFTGKKVYQPIGTLSGGEKTRLAIALLLLQNNNLLILDEPTTYLDVLSQRVILEALKSYKGSILIVSHTEEFIAELQPHKALLLPQNIYSIWKDEYLEQVGEM